MTERSIQGSPAAADELTVARHEIGVLRTALAVHQSAGRAVLEAGKGLTEHAETCIAHGLDGPKAVRAVDRWMLAAVELRKVIGDRPRGRESSGIREKREWIRPRIAPRGRESSPMAHTCPKCGAEPGQPCHTRSAGVLVRDPHVARIKAVVRYANERADRLSRGEAE